ncbi:hypothetical protein SOASR030_31590 [Leminorella grimontii]|uniref:Uncharacterized protein n=1 Tax=Leminorella grimontii TaxID=82981 RepID=A0AAV5N9C4_9GAMM|nr:hypothetical protein [Leminorella grimontii]KFC97109.1 hypothetical protein GLGR_0642 [Leminorella grimontii ATCC 33999 = DSM 5078]GKX57047.1 hypothetical protein SOASR030_31590 [Leminorella grimontii]VFS57230.1 Uncharacterised protein [Leminorella grimontii]
MWFLKFLFKKTFDAGFVEAFFEALSARIPELELVWKKGGSIVAKSDATSAVIKRGKRTLFCQNPRNGWIDLFGAGEDRPALQETAMRFQLGKEKPGYAIGVVCLVLYLILAFGTITARAGEETLASVYIVLVGAVLIMTAMMVTSYSANWSHTARSLCATFWILTIIATAISSLLLLPLVWAFNRQQLSNLYYSSGSGGGRPDSSPPAE